MNLTDKENINKELEILENAAISNSNEDTHSMVLAYLLLNEPDFLEVIFNKMGLNTLNLQKNLTVRTEENNTDILIKNDSSVLVIENKYKDRCRENKNDNTTSLKKQLIRYQQYAADTYPNQNRRFMYLRPFQHELDEDCKNWQTFKYKDILTILNNLKTNSETVNRYKKILEKIYEPQTICVSALKEILNLNNTNSINIDDERGDINGYAIEIHLNSNYNSFLELAFPYPFCDKVKNVTINLTVKESDETFNDIELLESLNKSHYSITCKYGYEWAEEFICKNTNFSEEVIKEKLKNSKIISILKQKNVF